MRAAKLVRSLMLAVGLSCGAGATPAALINAGFETGSLASPWVTTLNGGSATVVTSAYIAGGVPDVTYNPVGGTYFLAIGAGAADQWVTVTQSVTLVASEMLSGYAAFDWGDFHHPVGDADPNWLRDGVRVRILDASNAVIATPFYQDGTSQPNYYNGPWTAWSWTATLGGTYTLEYAARNTYDVHGDTFGYFDVGAAPTPIPEPATLALLGLSLAGLGFARRKKS